MRLQQLHFLRLAHEGGAELGDAFGVGGREQQRLALRRALLGDHGDVVVEAHVEHAVGFVQHQRVQRLQVQAAAFQVVHDAPRRADDDVRAMLQAGQLRAHRRAAAQRQDLDVVFGAGQAAQFLGHLVGQFACRAQHQRLHREAARVQVGQQRQAEGGGLAAAGLGLGDQVMAGQRQRQAGGLDRRHRVVAQLLQVLQRGRRQRQAGEGVGGGVHPRLSAGRRASYELAFKTRGCQRLFAAHSRRSFSRVRCALGRGQAAPVSGSAAAVAASRRLPCGARAGVAPITHFAPIPADWRCVQTVSTSQSTKRAARADPGTALLVAAEIAPARYRLSRGRSARDPRPNSPALPQSRARAGAMRL